MKIIKTHRLKDNLNFKIEYEEDGKQYTLFISAEKVIDNFHAVEQKRAADSPYFCGECGTRANLPHHPRCTHFQNGGG